MQLNSVMISVCLMRLSVMLVDVVVVSSMVKWVSEVR